MPIQRIKIGNVTILSKELTWDVIRIASQFLKEFCKWNPKEQTWSVTWRLLPKLTIAYRLINILQAYDSDYATQLKEAIDKVIKSIPPYIKQDSSYAFPLIDCDAINVWRTLRKFGGKFEKIVFDTEVGPIEIPVIVISQETLAILKKKLQEIDLPENLIERIKKIAISEAKVRIRPYSAKYIEILIPETNDALVSDLLELGRIRIKLKKIGGDVEEKEISLGKIYEKGFGVKILLPSYAIAFVEDILKSYGVEYEIDYGTKNVELQLNPSLKLYDYQQKALEKWLTEGNKKGTIVLPTGAGKTFVALAAISVLRKPSIIFVPNTWLLDQWIERISRYLGIKKGMIGKFGGGSQTIKHITVATYQSASKYIEKLADKFMLAVFDEAHHVPARTFMKTALYLRAPYRMALSATPKRADGNEELLFKLAGKIIYEADYPELIEKGVISPFVIRIILVPLPDDLKIQYQEAIEKADNAEDDVEKARWINKALRLASDNPIKIEVIKELLRRHKNEKVFVFCGSIAFAEKVYKAVREITNSAILTSKVTTEQEERLRKAFETGKIRVLVLVKKAEEGVDLPDASVAIIAGGSKQEREFIQRIGRVLRRSPGKKVAYIYELVTENTIEQAISKARGARKIAMKVREIVEKLTGLKSFDVIFWKKQGVL